MPLLRHARPLLLPISLLSLSAAVVAKTASPLSPLTKGAREPLQLYLTPMNTALFSFYVVFASCTFFQISSGHREIRDEKVHRVPYIISFVAILLYLATWIMRALYVGEGMSLIPSKTTVVVTTSVFLAIQTLTLMLAHLVISSAVLVMVYQRAQLEKAPTAIIPVWKKVVDGVLTVLTAVAFVVAAAMRASTPRTKALPALYDTIDRLGIYLLAICVANVWGSATFVKIQMRRANHPDGYIRRILIVILPLLSIQALNLIMRSVLTRLSIKINGEAYTLAYTIIAGFTGVASIHFFQALYREDPKATAPEAWPLKERDREQWRE